MLAIEQSIESDDDPSLIRFVLATVYYEQNDKELALEQLDEIVSFDEAKFYNEAVELKEQITAGMSANQPLGTLPPTMFPTSIAQTPTIFPSSTPSVVIASPSPTLFATHTVPAPTHTLFPTPTGTPTATLFPTPLPTEMPPRPINQHMTSTAEAAWEATATSAASAASWRATATAAATLFPTWQATATAPVSANRRLSATSTASAASWRATATAEAATLFPTWQATATSPVSANQQLTATSQAATAMWHATPTPVSTPTP